MYIIQCLKGVKRMEIVYKKYQKANYKYRVYIVVNLIYNFTKFINKMDNRLIL